MALLSVQAFQRPMRLRIDFIEKNCLTIPEGLFVRAEVSTCCHLRRCLTPSDRAVAATHRDLEELILNGNFRNDLYYCLDVVPIFMRRYPSDPKIFLFFLPHARWPTLRLV